VKKGTAVCTDHTLALLQVTTYSIVIKPWVWGEAGTMILFWGAVLEFELRASHLLGRCSTA
jgi:hypothetical protein